MIYKKVLTDITQHHNMPHSPRPHGRQDSLDNIDRTEEFRLELLPYQRLRLPRSRELLDCTNNSYISINKLPPPRIAVIWGKGELTLATATEQHINSPVDLQRFCYSGLA